MSRQRSGKRPWLAAGLALVYPGLGHAYLREWFRALLWFGLVLTTTALALPASALPDSGSGLSLDAVTAASRALPTEAKLAILVLFVLSTVDAYRLARERTQRSATADGETGGAHRCPHCNRKTDADLDFCQWCSEPLDGDDS